MDEVVISDNVNPGEEFESVRHSYIRLLISKVADYWARNQDDGISTEYEDWLFGAVLLGLITRKQYTEIIDYLNGSDMEMELTLQFLIGGKESLEEILNNSESDRDIVYKALCKVFNVDPDGYIAKMRKE